VGGVPAAPPAPPPTAQGWVRRLTTVPIAALGDGSEPVGPAPVEPASVEPAAPAKAKRGRKPKAKPEASAAAAEPVGALLEAPADSEAL
jgi:hypothetical protein